MGYVAANWAKIEHFGERAIQGVTDAEVGVAMAVQFADVKGPLASVNRMNQAGNVVVFQWEYQLHEEQAGLEVHSVS